MIRSSKALAMVEVLSPDKCKCLIWFAAWLDPASPIDNVVIIFASACPSNRMVALA